MPKSDVEDAVKELRQALKKLKKELEANAKSRVALMIHSSNPGKQIEDVDGNTEYGAGLIDVDQDE